MFVLISDLRKETVRIKQCGSNRGVENKWSIITNLAIFLQGNLGGHIIGTIVKVIVEIYRVPSHMKSGFMFTITSSLWICLMRNYHLCITHKVWWVAPSTTSYMTELGFMPGPVDFKSMTLALLCAGSPVSRVCSTLEHIASILCFNFIET